MVVLGFKMKQVDKVLGSKSVLNLPNAEIFNPVPRVVVTPNHKITFVATSYHFATVMNHNANICVFQWFWSTPIKGLSNPQKG